MHFPTENPSTSGVRPSPAGSERLESFFNRRRKWPSPVPDAEESTVLIGGLRMGVRHPEGAQQNFLQITADRRRRPGIFSVLSGRVATRRGTRAAPAPDPAST